VADRGDRRYVVTGGAGFVGSWLCERLLEDGAEVVCVDSLVTGQLLNIEHLFDHTAFAFQEADVCDGLPVAGHIDGVLHLASPASPVQYLRLPVETLRVGSEGTRRALDLAELHHARFLLASTSEVYGDPDEHPQAEAYWGHVNPIGPRSVYDEAKRFAEALTFAYRRHRGVDTAIARIFNTYGPRMDTADGRVVPSFIEQAITGQPLTVAGDGSQTRSLCYVTDTVDGLVRLLHSDAAGPVNIGSEDEVTVLELAKMIHDMTGCTSELEFIDLPEDDPRRRRPDVSRAQRCLGWKPTTGVDDGLRITIAWAQQDLRRRQAAHT
jgi:dTDP-glucose 4,6-dehydratase